MRDNNVYFVNWSTWIGSLAVLILVVMFSPARAMAQAAPGPQAGASPSDEPSSSPPPAVSQIGGHPSLAGNWALNKDQSDDPREKMREAMGGGGGGRGGWGGGRRGGGAGQGRGGDMMADFSQLAITQTPTSTKVVGSSGRVLALYSSDSSASPNSNSSNGSSDSGAYDDRGNNGDQATPSAVWNGNALVVTAQGRRGGSMTRSYELSPDGTQLYVTTKVDNPRLQQPVTYRFVYDADRKGQQSE